MEFKNEFKLISTHPIKKSDLGFHGNLFGGTMMSYLDESAAAYACQLCDTPRMVTVKIEEVVFKLPVKVGNILKIYGEAPVTVSVSTVTSPWPVINDVASAISSLEASII